MTRSFGTGEYGQASKFGNDTGELLGYQFLGMLIASEYFEFLYVKVANLKSGLAIFC